MATQKTTDSIGDPIDLDEDELEDAEKYSPVVTPYDIHDEQCYLINLQNRLEDVIESMNPRGHISGFAIQGVLFDLAARYSIIEVLEEDEE